MVQGAMARDPLDDELDAVFEQVKSDEEKAMQTAVKLGLLLAREGMVLRLEPGAWAVLAADGRTLASGSTLARLLAWARFAGHI
jgi:hypothetical protein